MIMEKPKFRINQKCILYIIICLVPMFVVTITSDLPILLGNWEFKAREILNLKIPNSNFYPAGSAIMLLPFVWDGPHFVTAVYFYFSLGAFIYWKICETISSKKLRITALAALPANPYLVWLCYTSQDTVFEFALLLSLVLFIVKSRPVLFVISGFLLVLTRPSYWVLFLVLGIFLYLIIRLPNKLKIIYLAPFIIFPMNILYNYNNYGSLSIANEAGMTAYFSYNKYYYLSHPKFDMDVFLSKGGHMEVNESKYDTEAQTNEIYTQKALASIKENPKETVLGLLQKLDSYIFDIQKIPHLPGEYFLSPDASEIVIGDQRLEWKFVIGNLIYAVNRALLVFLLFPALLIFYIGVRKKVFLQLNYKTAVLTFPWIFGLIPGLMFYTETRFKIISELILVPFICLVFTQFKLSDKLRPNLRER